MAFFQREIRFITMKNREKLKNVQIYKIYIYIILVKIKINTNLVI